MTDSRTNMMYRGPRSLRATATPSARTPLLPRFLRASATWGSSRARSEDEDCALTLGMMAVSREQPHRDARAEQSFGRRFRAFGVDAPEHIARWDAEAR